MSRGVNVSHSRNLQKKNQDFDGFILAQQGFSFNRFSTPKKQPNGMLATQRLVVFSSSLVENKSTPFNRSAKKLLTNSNTFWRKSFRLCNTTAHHSIHFTEKIISIGNKRTRLITVFKPFQSLLSHQWYPVNSSGYRPVISLA